MRRSCRGEVVDITVTEGLRCEEGVTTSGEDVVLVDAHFGSVQC